MGTVNLDQYAWAIGDDDNSDPDACTYGTCNVTTTKAIDEVFLVRILVENSGDKNAPNDYWNLWIKMHLMTIGIFTMIQTTLLVLQPK
jgi:hypothetical protein